MWQAQWIEHSSANAVRALRRVAAGRRATRVRVAIPVQLQAAMEATDSQGFTPAPWLSALGLSLRSLRGSQSQSCLALGPVCSGCASAAP
jgi:hypothetical protein